MTPRRITICFPDIQIVVPLNKEALTIAELIKAAISRYRRAIDKPDAEVRVLRLQLENGGILDPDDIVDDVLDHALDKVLAICDDGASTSTSSHDTTTHGKADVLMRSPYASQPQERSSVVEIERIDSPPTLGVRQNNILVEKSPHIPDAVPGRSSLRTEKKTNTNQHHVTMSPNVEKREIILPDDDDDDFSFTRGAPRKSRVSEGFFDAQARYLEERQKDTSFISRSFSDGRISKRMPPLKAPNNPEHTILIFPDDDAMSMGVEVVPCLNETGKLDMVEIIQIASDGRVGLDGRLIKGDKISAIDGQSIAGQTILRIRAAISSLSEKSKPSLTIARNIETFLQADLPQSLMKKPFKSALQQANTQEIGNTTIIELKKRPNGFGFTLTCRGTARGELLAYIGTVKKDGAAYGLLKAGDRLLMVNGESTANLTQPDIVARLKAIPQNGSVTLEISRVVESHDENGNPADSEAIAAPNSFSVDSDKTLDFLETSNLTESILKENRPRGRNQPLRPEDVTLMEFKVPLNATGSAGLGVSLKARVNVNSDGSRTDCGIFIKKLLVGGAAWKDGRLHVDDQLIGIEDIDLRQFKQNADASEAVTAKLKEIGHRADSVKLRILRALQPTSPALSSISSIRLTGESGVAASPHSGGLESPVDHLRRPSIASTSTRPSEVEDDLQPDPDAFDREAAVRKSMSEKRGMHATADPSNSKTFQNIKHQRQTSDPTKRRRSQSLDVKAGKAAVSDVPVLEPDLNSTPLIPSALSATGFKNPSFKHAVAGESGQSHDVTPIIAARQARAIRTDEKQGRRKSVGMAMRNLFRIGNRSRESSPEKREVDVKEDQNLRGIRMASPNLRGSAVPASSPHSTSFSRTDNRRAKVQSQYDPAPEPVSPTIDGICFGNSRFYRSLAPRGTEAKLLHTRITTKTPPSLLDTKGTSTCQDRSTWSSSQIPSSTDNTPVVVLQSSQSSASPGHRRHLITQFPVLSPSTATRAAGSPITREAVVLQSRCPASMSSSAPGPAAPRLPTTTPSTPGSRTPAAAALARGPAFKQRSLEEGLWSRRPRLPDLRRADGCSPSPASSTRRPEPSTSTDGADLSSTRRPSPRRSTRLKRSQLVQTSRPISSTIQSASNQPSTPRGSVPTMLPIFPTSRVFTSALAFNNASTLPRSLGRSSGRKKQRQPISSAVYPDNFSFDVPESWHQIPVIHSPTSPQPPTRGDTVRKSSGIRTPSFRFATSCDDFVVQSHDSVHGSSIVQQSNTPLNTAHVTGPFSDI